VVAHEDRGVQLELEASERHSEAKSDDAGTLVAVGGKEETTLETLTGDLVASAGDDASSADAAMPPHPGAGPVGGPSLGALVPGTRGTMMISRHRPYNRPARWCVALETLWFRI
jgi:hypothetical protein